MDATDLAPQAKPQLRSNALSSSFPLARANSRNRGISIRTVSPSYHIRPNPDAEPLLMAASTRARNNSVNTQSTTSSTLQSPAGSPGLCSAQPPCGPELKTFHSRRSSTTTRNDSTSQTPEPQPLVCIDEPGVAYGTSSPFISGGSPDFALPPAAELAKLDINEQLRLLALKEMSVVEMRDSIAVMKSKLHDTECDLTKLRHLIQKSLYRELNLQHQATQRTTRHTPTKEKDTLGPLATSTEAALFGGPTESNVSLLAKLSDETPPHTAKGGQRLSRIWANLAKPISFIQSLDLMILNEFEKSLVGDIKHGSPGHTAPRKDLQGRRAPRNNQDQAEKHLSHNQSHAGQYLPNQKQYSLQYQPEIRTQNGSSDQQAPGNSSHGQGMIKKDPDDMFYAVSNSLWTFVNEVKTNMISTINENALNVVQPPKSPVTKEASDEIPFSPLNCDLEDPQDFDKSGDDEESIDLSMYASMRRTK